MGIKCGIVGLPNVGKSTLFNALTAAEIAAENYPFCTIDPNVGVVTVPDPRLDALAAIVKPREDRADRRSSSSTSPGLVEGASQGEGLGNQFLAHIRETHAIAHLVRCFVDDDIVHVAGKVNPLHDIEIIDTELDARRPRSVQKVVPARRARPRRRTTRTRRRTPRCAEEAAATRSRTASPRAPSCSTRTTRPTAERAAPDHREARDVHRQRRRGLASRTIRSSPPCASSRPSKAPRSSSISRGASKPSSRSSPKPSAPSSSTSLGLDEPGLNRVIRSAYRLLGLKTFYTAGPKEVRAWTVRARRDGAASGRRDPHRLRARLHPRRGDRLRRTTSRAAASTARAKPASSARGQDLRRARRRRDALPVQRLRRPEQHR